MDRMSRKRLIELFSRSTQPFLSAGPAAECARIVVARFGGEVRGFQCVCNPAAGLGHDHDFAITEDRFLVDPWLWRYQGDRPVLDLADTTEVSEAIRRYGPEENWFVRSEALLRLMCG
jgi:hypothetical protein